MKFSSEDIGRLLASGRNYASTIVGFIGGIGVMSASQAKGLTDALNDIWNGLALIVQGTTSAWQILVVAFPIIGVVLAKWASNSAKTVNQSASVNVSVKEDIAAGKPIPLEVKAAAIDTAAAIPEVAQNNPTIKVGDPVLAQAVPATIVVAR